MTGESKTIGEKRHQRVGTVAPLPNASEELRSYQLDIRRVETRCHQPARQYHPSRVERGPRRAEAQRGPIGFRLDDDRAAEAIDHATQTLLRVVLGSQLRDGEQERFES